MQMPAVGDGPIELVDGEGKQHAIPLSAISFKDGVVQSEVDVDGLQEWLEYLVLQGQLVSGPAPAAVDAMIFEASNEGPTGNDIVVEVREFGVDVVEIKVTETHVYEGLIFDASEQSVSVVLDVAEKGIVHHTDVTGTTADSPAGGLVLESKLPPDDRAGWVLKNGAGTSLAVLEPRGAGWDKGTGKLTVLVDDVDPVAMTFTLKVAWEITATVGPTDLTGANPLADLKFAVTVKPPAPGAPLHLPMPGRVALKGGAARVPTTAPTKAQATLMADE